MSKGRAWLQTVRESGNLVGVAGQLCVAVSKGATLVNLVII